jgi:hypothetical protein
MSRPGARVLPLVLASASALGLALAPALADDETPGLGGEWDQPVVLDDKAVQPEPDAHPEGEYGGVIPGKDGKLKVVSGKPARRKVPSKPTMTWVGFQMLGSGSSRVFLQLSASADYKQSVSGDELIVTLPGFRLEKSNDTRPLDTKFFGAAVTRVAAKRVGSRGRGKNKTPAGVEVRIQFKAAKDARSGDARLEKGDDGFHYLYLDFGPP